jgi:hypothetical protein
MIENDDDVLKELPDEAIELTFPCDGMNIAVLDNRLFNNMINENGLVFGRITINENGQRIIETLTPEENEKSYQAYLEIMNLFGGKK